MKVISVNDISSINEQKKIMIVNNNSSENILLLGSCRMTAYLNYLIHHELFGNKYNYLCALVHIPEIKELTLDIIHNEELKSQIYKSKILIAEYMKKYHFFNTESHNEKSIFKIYDSFTYKIILPNWYDICLYTKDLIYYRNIKNEFLQLLHNEINLQEFTSILQECQKKELERHIGVLNKAQFSELITYTNSNVKRIRLANSINHPANIYLIEVYRLIIEKFFEKSLYYLPQSVIDLNNQYQFLQSFDHDTKLTYYDKVCLGINIDSEHYLDEKQSNDYILDCLTKI